jgi:pyruvate/2-oxoglutarate dehydrogenase complex dihydrolipoamide dehydrogenase (E3) component
MTKDLTPDLCVIGAGTAGLSVASAAAALGVPVVLVEKGTMGGSRLNHGCVPSKALLAAAHAAHRARSMTHLGVSAVDVQVDFARVMAHVRQSIATTACNDSEARYRAMGVQVIRAAARFVAHDTVEAGGFVIRARRFIVATGSSTVVPPIPGLEQIRVLTTASAFTLDKLPQHLVILGACAVGTELAQAFVRLGAGVSLLDEGRALAHEDAEFAEVITSALRRDGVDLREATKVLRAEALASGFRLHLDGGALVEGTHLLVATVRRPNIEGLGLEAAGVRRRSDGTWAGANLRTSNRRIYFVGDAAGGPHSTHSANHHAGRALRGILFRMPSRAAPEPLPRALFTDPELAACGLSEDEARQRHGVIRVLRWPLAETDRARTDGVMTGHAKLVVGRNRRVLGVAIAGRGAGELIGLWQVAVARRLTVRDMAAIVLPYPTLNEVGKRAAMNAFAASATNPWLRRLLGLLRKFG